MSGQRAILSPTEYNANRAPWEVWINRSLEGNPVGCHYWPTEVREQVLRRDKYTCQNCHKSMSSYHLVAHHKKYSDFVDTTAMVTLCNRCHGKVNVLLRIINDSIKAGFLNENDIEGFGTEELE